MSDDVLFSIDGGVVEITLNRPEALNALTLEMAQTLYERLSAWAADPAVRAVVVRGAGDRAFCAGADLTAISDGRGNSVRDEPPDAIVGSLGPMGPTRLQLTKPVVAAVEGHAVAGGLELACWADLRVAARDATFGVYCRRWGVPLIDGGTVRLPRLIGQSRAMDMILTGRSVDADEALSFGLANRIVPDGAALQAAIDLAEQLAAFPQTCMRLDRASSIEQWGLPIDQALEREAEYGRDSLRAGAAQGAGRFAGGKGRGGNFEDI